MVISGELKEFRKKELVSEMRSVLSIIASKMAIPLYLLFWIADILYVPHLKWEFLVIRLTAVPICLLTIHYANKFDDVKKIELVALFFAFSLATGINLMIGLIGDPSTPYYAGLGLVAIGSLSFIPFSGRQYLLAVAGIYIPYYATVAFLANGADDWKSIGVNSFFISSAVIICLLIRFFQEGLRIKEIESRIKLNDELMNRDVIIREKTDEAVKLNSLSHQFSPQIVEAIKNGKINLESGGGTRAQICAIFIDIVNSTERVTRIDKDKVDKVLSKFLDESIKIFLKYDITIDKFLGDGILAFCNAPIKRSDFVSRVINAAIEIREKIKSEQDFYEKNWQKELQIRVGISKGYANVGFYGGKKHFRSYTAIGPVINLSSRLCSSAAPNQIICDYDVYEEAKEEFEMEFVGKKTLKGFDDDVIHTYEVKGTVSKVSRGDVQECPQCGSILSLENDDKGHFVFVCRSCCSTVNIDSSTPQADLQNPKPKAA